MNLKPDDGPLTDSQVPGLMIRPNASGGKWALRYVAQRRASAVKWDWARVRALAMRGQIDSGHDPIQERRRERVMRNFSNAFASAWIECPRVADNVFQRASAIVEWAFAAYPDHVMCNSVPSARALLPSRGARHVSITTAPSR
ncbi:hypothetical protein [Paraburkholderia silvatlantica]|uniref:hypothetical protein n=1 Tax=Paraburkholderia silvatlantica TaxID=321895 RepID=UPI003752AD01